MEMSWVSGFVTAGNGEWIAGARRRGINSDIDFLKGLDNPALETWLVNFCKQNPLKNLVSASLALQQALIDKVTKGLGLKK
jgi:hypothetical protein